MSPRRHQYAPPVPAVRGRRRRARSPGSTRWRVAQAADRPNVVVIIVDTLRADHAFGKRARTPNIDALARQGLSFTRFYPEAMPTVPARRSILTRAARVPVPRLAPLPRPAGRARLGADRGRAHDLHERPAPCGLLDGVRDRQHVARLLPALGPLPAQLRPLRQARRPDRRHLRRRVGARAAPLAAARDRGPGHARPGAPLPRQRPLLATTRRSRSPRACSATARGCSRRRSRQRPFCLVVDTFEPHEPWTPPRHYIDMYGDPDYHGPEPARPYYAPVEPLPARAHRRRCCSSACARSTRAR